MPKKEKTPSFIVELPLIVDSYQEKKLNISMQCIGYVYNAILCELLKRLDLMKQSKDFQKARKIIDKKEKTAKFKELKEKFKFQKFNIYNWCSKTLTHSWFSFSKDGHLDALTIQAVADRAWTVVEQYSFSKRGRPKFKKTKDSSIIDGKQGSGIKYKDTYIKFHELKLQTKIDLKDEIIKYSLTKKVKLVKIIRKKLNSKNKYFYFAQLTCEGIPLHKTKHIIGENNIGLDLGPSIIAITSLNTCNNEVNYIDLKEFCSDINEKQKQIILLQRKEDRQRRLNNPDNYNENGTIKKSNKKMKWKKSERGKKNSQKKANMQRKIAAARKTAHGTLVNEIISYGKNIYTESLSYKAWQKVFGKSIGHHAPALFISLLENKIKNVDGEFIEIPTVKSKLSQTCLCGNIVKKSLNERWHNCAKCGIIAQRDIFSSFLSLFWDEKSESLNLVQAQKAWTSAGKLMQARLSSINEEISNGMKVPACFGLNQRQIPLPVLSVESIYEDRDVVNSCENKSRELDRVYKCKQNVDDLNSCCERLGDSNIKSKQNHILNVNDDPCKMNRSQNDMQVVDILDGLLSGSQ